MKAQNRPLSATDIFNNLHGAVGKTVLQRILNDSVDRNVIVCKINGKQAIYVYSQVLVKFQNRAMSKNPHQKS